MIPNLNLKIPLFLLFVMLNVTNFGQEFPDLSQYYPLEIGNKWQYNHVECGFDYSRGDITEREIMRDTVLNSERYFVIELRDRDRFTDEINTWICLERIDTLNKKVYSFNISFEEEESLLFDFSGTEDNIIFNELNCINNSKENLVEKLNIYKDQLVFGAFNGDHTYINKLAKNIGFIYSISSIGLLREAQLIYAKINDNEYGTYVDLSEEINQDIINANGRNNDQINH